MLADGVDVILVDLLGLLTGESGRGFGNGATITYYQTMDKWLDFYYLSFEAGVSWRWTNHLARNTSIFLFGESSAWSAGRSRLQRPLRVCLLASPLSVQPVWGLRRSDARPGNVHSADGWQELVYDCCSWVYPNAS